METVRADVRGAVQAARHNAEAARAEIRGAVDSARQEVGALKERTKDFLERERQTLAEKLRTYDRYPLGELSHTLLWPSIAATSALILYEYQCYEVNRARAERHMLNIKPHEAHPTTEPFERLFRLHQNTGEALITVIPSIYAFSLFVSPRIGALLGGMWTLGRFLFVYGHRFNPELEKPGYAMSYVSQMALLMGSAVSMGRFAVSSALEWIAARNTVPTPEIEAAPVAVVSVINSAPPSTTGVMPQAKLYRTLDDGREY